MAICVASLSLTFQQQASAQVKPNAVEWSYLIDGGAIEFIWVPTLLGLATYKVKPAASPRLFSSSEGGAFKHDDTIPSYYNTIASGFTVLGILANPSDGRWYHAKGFLQASAMANQTTGSLKKFFGRQRPSFDAQAPVDEDRKSFPSGHATSALRITTYVGLYLRYHVFDEMRGDRAIVWPEVIAYPALAVLATYAAYTRVDDNRHHVSDVVAGGAIGLSMSALFFYYQERRLKRHSSRESQAYLSIWSTGQGVSVGWSN